MTNHLPDTNVFSQIFKNNSDVQSFVEKLNPVICSTVYIECLQGSRIESGKKQNQKVSGNLCCFLSVGRNFTSGYCAN